MWSESFVDKEGKTKYRFYERYIDPLTGKRKRTSVVMNKRYQAVRKGSPEALK